MKNSRMANVKVNEEFLFLQPMFPHKPFDRSEGLCSDFH